MQLDLSSFAKEYFDLLKNLILDDRYSEKAIFCLRKIIQLSPSIPSEILLNLKALIQKTFNEKQKVRLLPLVAEFKETEFILQQMLTLKEDDSLNVLP